MTAAGSTARSSCCAAGRPSVLAKDRDQVDVQLGALYLVKGDVAHAIAAYDSALASQADLPEALWGKGAALALDRQWTPAFQLYEKAVRARTGVMELRCDYARDLIRAGRLADASRQLDEAALLDAEHPTARRCAAGSHSSAISPTRRAFTLSRRWCGAHGATSRASCCRARSPKLGDVAGAADAAQPVRDRIARNEPPSYVYRTARAEWMSVHELPAVEAGAARAAGEEVAERRAYVRSAPNTRRTRRSCPVRTGGKYCERNHVEVRPAAR
jgi:tetratricopeptide (TPR) repeat protein